MAPAAEDSLDFSCPILWICCAGSPCPVTVHSMVDLWRRAVTPLRQGSGMRPVPLRTPAGKADQVHIKFSGKNSTGTVGPGTPCQVRRRPGRGPPGGPGRPSPAASESRWASNCQPEPQSHVEVTSFDVQAAHAVHALGRAAARAVHGNP